MLSSGRRGRDSDMPPSGTTAAAGSGAAGPTGAGARRDSTGTWVYRVSVGEGGESGRGSRRKRAGVREGFRDISYEVDETLSLRFGGHRFTSLAQKITLFEAVYCGVAVDCSMDELSCFPGGVLCRSTSQFRLVPSLTANITTIPCHKFNRTLDSFFR